MREGSWLSHSCGNTEGSGVQCCGQTDDESCPRPVTVVVTEDFASMFLHDAIADAQAEAGSFTDLFCREERIEDAIRVRDSVTVVAEGNFDGVVRLRAHDLDAGGTPHLANGIVGVIENIEEDLLQLV